MENGLYPIHKRTLSLEQGFYGMYQTILNRVTTEPNVLYTLLKKKRPQHGGPALIWNLVVTLLLLAPVGVIGTLLEILAVVFQQGGVVRFVAEKR